jgi:hypothetical protein
MFWFQEFTGLFRFRYGDFPLQSGGIPVPE